MAKVLITLTDDFEEIEAVSVIDVLRRGHVEVTTASIGASVAVRGAHGIEMKSDALFADVKDDDYDAIVLPGGPGAPSFGQCEALVERLVRQKKDGKLVCAICAAPVVLCERGLVDSGVAVTCYPTCALDLDRPCAGVPVVSDSGIITGQAPGAATLFALVILQELLGESHAQKVARALVTDVLESPEFDPDFE